MQCICFKYRDIEKIFIEILSYYYLLPFTNEYLFFFPYLLKSLFKGAKVYVLTKYKGDRGNINIENKGPFSSEYKRVFARQKITYFIRQSFTNCHRFQHFPPPLSVDRISCSLG